MTIRASKALLLFALGFYYTMVVFNNTNDYNSNLTFVRHVLLMDTTYPGNHGMWRSIHSPTAPWLFFVSIVSWEIVTGLLLYLGGFLLAGNLRSSAATFNAAKRLGVVALTLSLLMWLSGFLSVGNEWFLMWQSKEWSGEAAAGRMFAIVGIVLLYLVLPDVEGQHRRNRRSLHYAPPDFLWRLVALAVTSWLSLRKAAYVGVSRVSGRKSGYAPVGMTILFGS